MESTSTLQQEFKLGVEHLQAHRWDEAESLYRRMLLQWPKSPEIHHNLGYALKHRGQYPEAIAEYQTAVALHPGYPEAWSNLGDALRETSQPAPAAEAYRRAVTLRPGYVEAWNSLGICLRETHQPWRAIEAYRRALALRPDTPEVWNNLGVVLRLTDQAMEAIDAFRQALSLQPNVAQTWSNLAVALKDTGQLDESVSSADRAIALQPGDAEIFSNRLYTLYFHPNYDDEAIYRQACLWNERFARPLAGQIAPHPNDPSPGRRLRIGYVSGDFRNHCQALFTTPLLINHDHAAFEIFCYSGVVTPDPITAKLRRLADHWRTIAGLPHAAVAQLVRQDKIDILVDLALHMASNRLGVFARKPAPVQVTWLGYPGTTGLEAIDYRLTDPRLDPLEYPEIRNSKFEIRINDPNSNVPMGERSSDQTEPLDHSNIGALEFDSNFEFRISNFATQEPYYSERSIRLPYTYWCYDPRGMEPPETPGSPGNPPSSIFQIPNPKSEIPPAPAAPDLPDPGPLPALAAGRITFGCLNNFCKVTDQALALWGRVLAATPNSQIVLLAPQGPHRQRIVKQLAVDPQRVQFTAFLPRRQYLAVYRRIDISLDTIPYNGHTTSLDSLWMGVPVVTRLGGTSVGRGGLSQLYNLGLMELVARSDDQFVQLAVGLAGDLDRLSGLRAKLRGQMEKSPLMDAPKFARHVEAAYRRMWQIWCAGQKP